MVPAATAEGWLGAQAVAGRGRRQVRSLTRRAAASGGCSATGGRQAAATNRDARATTGGGYSCSTCSYGCISAAPLAEGRR